MPAAKIPEDITCDIRDTINGILGQFLAEVQKMTGAPEIFVNCRLNRSDQKTGPSPCCVGWVESYELKKKREAIGLDDPAITRFLDNHLSPIYSECICNRTVAVNARDYGKLKTIAAEKVVGSRAYDVILGQFYRRYACIIADGRRTGTVTIGSNKPPSDSATIEKELGDWAQGFNSKTRLIEYLKNNFDLGGPPK